MVVMERRPEPKVRSGYEATLRVERTDISFEDVPGDKVRIRVTVHNTGSQSSRPTFMRLESAPLGAFVPWQPLAAVAVPALEPGESRELSTEVARPHPAPLGQFDRVPPRKVLTAVNSPDEAPPAPSDAGFAALMDLFLRRQGDRSGSRSGTGTTASLAPDLLELVGREQPHWAGNINVFVHNRPVERHLATALRVYPGRGNLAMFMVGGGGRADAYAFELVGLDPDWKTALYDVTSNRSLLLGPCDMPIEETRWVEADGGLLAILATHPPAGCEAGRLEVHVTRRSCGRTAIVEFDLDPSAQGAGCYSV
jgi:hypothetical protein